MICAVIPTLNSEEQLPKLLSQLRGHVDRIVITDGGSSDRTLKIALENEAVIALGTAGRGTQLRRGKGWAMDCDWLLFLHADCELPANWEAIVTHHMKAYPGKAGYFDLRFDSAKFAARVIEFTVRIRCAVFGLPYGDQGVLISKELYEAASGYPDTPLFEDVALMKTLGKKRIRRLGGRILTDAEKFERSGFFRRGWRNFGLLRRYLGGEAPEDIAKDYK